MGNFITSVTVVGTTTAYNDYTGMRITVGASPITVTALGRWKIAGQTITHTVKLITVAGHVDVAGGSVSINSSLGTAGAFQYVSLGSPIILAAATDYLLVSSNSGGEAYYTFNGTTLTNAAVASIAHATYFFGSWLEDNGGPNQCYGPLDFTYDTGPGGTGAISFAGSGTAAFTPPTTGTGAIGFGGAGVAAITALTATGAGAITFGGSGSVAVANVMSGTGTGAVTFGGKADADAAPHFDIPVPPEWSMQLLQPDGAYLGPLTSATARRLTFLLDGAATAQFTMPGEHPETAAVVELATDVAVARNGRRLFRGRIGGSTQTVAAQSSAASFAAVDYRGMLDRRLIWSASRTHYPAFDQSDLAWTLIVDSQTTPGGNLGISRGAAAATGVLRDRDYTAGSSVGGAVAELGNVANGFDWEVDANLAFNLYHPQRGRNTGLVLVYGRDVVAADTAVNPGDYANAVYYTGASGTTPVEILASGGFPAGIGRWDLQKSDSNAAPQIAVAEQAVAAAAAASQPRPSFTATLAPGVWNPYLLWLGDYVRLIIREGRLNVDVTRRIVQVDITLDDNGGETVALTIGVAPARLSDRINTLTKNVSGLQVAPGGGGGGGGGGATGYPAVPFVFAGPIANSISPAIVPHADLTAVGLSAHLSTLATGATTIALLKNGTSAATLTIPASTAYAYTTFTAIPFASRTDSYSIQVTGTSGADLGGEIETA